MPVPLIDSTPSFGWSEVVLSSNNPTFIGETLNLRRHKRALPVHRWELEFSTPPLDTNDQRVFFAFMNKLRGQLYPFKFVHPIYSTPRGNFPRTDITVQVKADSGSTSVNLSGFRANDRNAVKAGDLITFEAVGHTKVYAARDDVEADESGDVVFQLQSPLIKTVLPTTKVIGNDVPFTLSMTEDVVSVELSADSANMVEFTVTAVEEM